MKRRDGAPQPIALGSTVFALLCSAGIFLLMNDADGDGLWWRVLLSFVLFGATLVLAYAFDVRRLFQWAEELPTDSTERTPGHGDTDQSER